MEPLLPLMWASRSQTIWGCRGWKEGDLGPAVLGPMLAAGARHELLLTWAVCWTPISRCWQSGSGWVSGDPRCCGLHSTSCSCSLEKDFACFGRFRFFERLSWL